MSIVQTDAYRVEQAALSYASRGWLIVPLYGLFNGTCNCSERGNCVFPGKHPRLKDWPNHATADPKVLANYWERWPLSNCGVRLGPGSGIVDIEYDNAEGEATAERLLGGCQTPSYRSSRSTHRLMRFQPDLGHGKSVLHVQGLEVRLGTDKKGQQSVLPPSQHGSGTVYSWLPGLSPDDVAVAPIPDCLLKLLATAGEASADNAPVFVMGSDGHFWETPPDLGVGKRTHTLWRLIGRFLAAYGPHESLMQHAQEWAAKCKPALPPEKVAEHVTGLVKKHMAKAQQGPVESVSKQPHTLAPGFTMRPLSSVKGGPVQWLWHYRLPLGKLSLIAGDGSVGKTTLVCDLASRLSQGTVLPDGSEALACDTFIMTAEDGDGDTIRHRIEAMGGNLDRIHVPGEGEMFDSFRQDIAKLKQTLTQCSGVGLVVFDTLPDFIGEGVDDYKNAGVRQALRGLIQFAADCRVAVVGVCHFRKGGDGTSGHKLLGSVAYRNLARSVLYVLHDPEDALRRVVWHDKHNLSPQASTLAFSMVPGPAATLAWEPGEVFIENITPYLNAGQGKRQGRPPSGADAWLVDCVALAFGGKKASEVIAAGEAAGFKRRTLYRAAEKLGVIMEGGYWRLPGPEDDQVFRV